MKDTTLLQIIAADNALANAEADADRFHYVVAIGMRIIKAFAWMHQLGLTLLVHISSINRCKK